MSQRYAQTWEAREGHRDQEVPRRRNGNVAQMSPWEEWRMSLHWWECYLIGVEFQNSAWDSQPRIMDLFVFAGFIPFVFVHR